MPPHSVQRWSVGGKLCLLLNHLGLVRCEVLPLVKGVNQLKQKVKQLQSNNNERGLTEDLLADLDARIVMVKLADHLHNIHTVSFLSAEKQKEKVEETLICPLLKNLGCPGNHSHPSQIGVLKVTLSRASQRTNSQIQFVIMMGNIIFEILGQGGEGHTPKKDQAAKRNQTFNLIDALKLRLDLKSRCSNGRHQRRRSCDADQTRWASKPPYLERDWR